MPDWSLTSSKDTKSTSHATLPQPAASLWITAADAAGRVYGGGMSADFADACAAALVALWAAAVTPALLRHDLAEHRLPNRYTLPGWFAAVAALTVAGMLRGAFPAAAFVMLVAATIILGLAGLVGAFGMGDAKLAVPLAVGLVFAHPAAPLAAGMLALVSGTFAGVMIAARERNLRVHIPFGPPILLGYWTSYAWAAGGVLT